MLSNAALRAIADFLRDAEARDLLGLHRIRVGEELMTRGGLADLVELELAVRPAEPEAL